MPSFAGLAVVMYPNRRRVRPLADEVRVPVLDLEVVVVGLLLAHLDADVDDLVALGVEPALTDAQILGGDPALADDPEGVLGGAAEGLGVVG
jgi:hypothetical protein